jgi:hypothetical protein
VDTVGQVRIAVSGEGWCECREVRGSSRRVWDPLAPRIQAHQVDGDGRGDVLEMRPRETAVARTA